MIKYVIHCAAIGYMCYQNAPSDPFVLDIPDNPTKEELEAILKTQFLAMHGGGADQAPDEEGEVFTLKPVVQKGNYGDVQVWDPEEENLWLFVTFPPAHRERLLALLGIKVEAE